MANLEKALSLLERIDPQYRHYIRLLNEGDSRLKMVDRIIDQVFSSYFDPDSTVRGREYYVNNNPNTTWRQWLIFNLRHTFGLMENRDAKYLPVVARLAYSNEVGLDLRNDNGLQINTLQRIVQLFKKDENFFQEVRANPNITFGQLVERLKETFAQEDAADEEAANSVQNTGSDYIIKEVPDFETAKYYGDRSCSTSKLCYTQNESTWDSYASSNTVYVCLRNGWENIPEEATEGNPYDLYGTSMIFVFVNAFGRLVNSNCRWNHGNKGEYNGDVDHAFTKATLSQTIGMPFDSVFNTSNALIKIIEQGEIDVDDIDGEFIIPEGTRYIGEHAFGGCRGLTSITIPNSVTSIGVCAFEYCRGLTSITIPNSVTSIGVCAFIGCRGLTSVTIGNSVTSIGDAAFEYCRGLTSVTIPNSVTSIGSSAFCGCKGLTSLTIPNSVKEIGNYAFKGCSSLTSITIPNSVTAIGDEAFYGCSGLTSMSIGSSVAYIGHEAFSGCSGLNSVNIPNSVTSIGGGAFLNCSGLTSVSIPNSVTSIGTGAFYDCNRNLVIYVNSEEVASLVKKSVYFGPIKIIQ